MSWARLRNSIEFECNDTGHLYNWAYFVEGGFVKVPFFVPTIFGILSGVGSGTGIFVRSGPIDCNRIYADPSVNSSKFRDQLHVIVTPVG